MKIYFVEVTTYSSTNKLGQYIAKQASVYDHWLRKDNHYEEISCQLQAVQERLSKSKERLHVC